MLDIISGQWSWGLNGQNSVIALAGATEVAHRKGCCKEPKLLLCVMNLRGHFGIIRLESMCSISCKEMSRKNSVPVVIVINSYHKS